MKSQEERTATEEDLRETLTSFWLEMVQGDGAEYPERLKASELLAKYILEAGKTPIQRRGPRRPPTAEVLKLAERMEREQHGSTGS